MRSPHRATLLTLLAIVLLAACTAAPPSPSPQPSSPSQPSPSSPSAPPSGDPSAPPPSVAPTPAPTVPPSNAPAAWTKPKLIADGSCTQLSFTVDAAGRHHVVAVCDAKLRYLASSNGSTWTSTDFAPPSERVEQEPLLAVDGNTVHLAYNRMAIGDGACGDDGYEDLGVYVRTRQLPDGAWTDPARLGVEGDRLQAFRVADGVRHLTVRAASDGPVFYQAISGSGSTRIEIPNAVDTSLRIGDDGRARIAFANGQTLRYGIVSGQRLSLETIAKVSDTNISAPQLVLGAGDRPFVLWTQNRDAGGGCLSIDPGPLDGTYFGTNAGSGWTTGRISKAIAPMSLTLDPDGHVHALLTGEGSLRHLSSETGSDWRSSTISGVGDAGVSIIRVDPASDSLVVVGLDYERGIVVLSKSL